ncbi:acetyl esterase [Nocardia transvalensis]|uniref:Acetyl esterase n=1 Tax=Nocardia transvalensis TaxID=37333 RepID=A0A7W9UL54_9NOCA|nr:alpha/beta hydrolase [Nocardia transvalensis]MBB5916350.1 acetyl esterase [Nocardia transvalensis]
MNDDTGRAPLRLRLLSALRKEPDWSALTDRELAAFRDSANRTAASRAARVITGIPDRGARIRWQRIALPGRDLPVRVYRPTGRRAGGGALPLVVHVHGGGFVGTAAQCDWANSHLAARLPAVVVSVEHRLLAAGTPISAVVDDGWDVLRHLVDHAADWGIDPGRAAVAGESTGGLVAALAARRARDAGLPLRAQVLVNPATDLTESMYDYPSVTEHADSPTLTVAKLRLFVRLAVPPGTDRAAMSPLHAGDLGGLAPALVVVPTVDPVADHGRRYAERLRAAGTPARLVEYPGATHAFLATPGVVPQAKAARADIAAFLRTHLGTTPHPSPSAAEAGER